MPKKFEPETRERALRMLAEAMPEHKNKSAAVRHVAGLLGMSPETLRTWARRVEVDQGRAPGVKSDVVEENRQLRRQVAELRQAISFSISSTRVRRRNSTSSLRSSLLSPSRRPASTSSWAIHRRRHDWLIPRSDAIFATGC